MPEQTIQLRIDGKYNAGPALRTASAGMRTFADGTIGHFRRVTSAVFNLQNAIAGIALYGAGRAIFDPAIEMETFETQFETLLGSMDAAKERLADLAQFAEETPFELPQLAQASRLLETLTKGALASGDELRMVGDVAASVGTDIGELSVWFGRLYDGIQSGRPVGEALARLQELGVVSGEARGKLEKLQKSNRSGAEVWAYVVQEMERYRGGMERLSQTTAGRLSTLRDNWKAVRREVGDAALPALGQAIEELLAKIEQLRASGELEKWGQSLGAAITTLSNSLMTLATFIAEHREELRTLGISYAVYRTITSLTAAIRLMRIEMIAAGGQATLLQSALSGLGTGVVVAGVAYVSTLMFDLYNVTKEAKEEAKALGVEISKTPEPWWLRALSQVNPMLGQFARMDRARRTGDLGTIEGPAENVDAQRGGQGRDARMQAVERAARQAEAAQRLEQAAAGAMASMIGVAKNQIPEWERVFLDRFNTLQEIAEKEKLLEESIANDRAENERHNREIVLRDLIDGAEEEISTRKAMADKLKGEIESEWEDALFTDRRTLREREKQAEERAKVERKAQRHIARAREQVERWMKGGATEEQARGRLSARGEMLLRIDDKRQEEARLREEAATLELERAAREQELSDLTKEQLRAVDEQSAETRRLVDELKALRESLEPQQRVDTAPITGVEDKVKDFVLGAMAAWDAAKARFGQAPEQPKGPFGNWGQDMPPQVDAGAPTDWDVFMRPYRQPSTPAGSQSDKVTAELKKTNELLAKLATPGGVE